MKFVKFTVVALFAALLAVGCADEKISFDTEKGNAFEEGNSSENGENTPSDVGYLDLSGLTVSCRTVENDPDTGVDPSVSTYSTRTSTVDASNFDCSIINDAGEVVMSFKYGDRPTESITLASGDYIFKIQSGEVEGAVWESPVYGATRAFKIVRKQPTSLSEVVCTLMQIKVTITYAADLMERFGEATNTTVTIGENSLVYALNESRAGYFHAPQMSNTIDLLIDGQYAADKVNFNPVKMTNQITGVKVGQHSKIHLYIEHADEGNIKVNVTLRDWVTDEVIPCNVADLVSEEEWKEEENEDPTPTDAPDILWEGYDFSKRYPITDDLTVDLVVVASSGIKELLCEIDSETLTPEQLSSVNLCNILNLCYPKQSYDSKSPTVYVDVEQPLRDLNFAVAEEVLNQKLVNLSITKFLGILETVSGTSLKYHNFVLTVTDNNNVTTVKTLQLQTGK